MGNICRSPTGEGVLRKMVAQRGLEARIVVDSAGTTGYHVGEKADRRMRAAAGSRGYPLTGVARQIGPADIDAFSLIVPMDRDNLHDIRRLVADGQPSNHIQLLSAFLPKGAPPDVPDPYYGGPQGFDVVIDMIEDACPVILRHLLGEPEPVRGRKP